jgi:hypothetical protein
VRLARGGAAWARASRAAGVSRVPGPAAGPRPGAGLALVGSWVTKFLGDGWLSVGKWVAQL